MDANQLSALVAAASQGRIGRRQFIKAALGMGLSLSAATSLLAAGTRIADAAVQQPKTSAIIGLPNPVKSLDPFMVMSSVTDFRVVLNICDSLFDLDTKTYEIKPVLVESWKLVDSLTWSISLKKGIQFHKGYGEMTADDWAFWANKWITSKGAGYFLFGSGDVKQVNVKDKYTLEVLLNKPWPAFPVTSFVTAGGIVFSKAAYEKMGPEEFAKNPIGTGPFELESWTPGGDIVLKKNVNYHQPGLPKLEKLTFQVVQDPVVREEKIKKGEIDWAVDIPPQDIPDLRKNSKVQVIESAAWNWDYISFNLTLPNRPWLDKRVRQAISYAIDRDSIVQNIYYGSATAEDDPLIPGFIGADPDQPFYPNKADLAKAKALLAEAGFANGFNMPCITSEKSNLRRELQLVAEQLKQVGITVKIEQVDAATYRTRWQNLEWDTLLEDATMASPDSDSAMYWWYHTNPKEVKNPGNDGYSNTAVDDLLDRARVSSEKDERAKLYRQAQELIAADCPKAITDVTNVQYVLTAGLTGFTPFPNYLFPQFKNMGWGT